MLGYVATHGTNPAVKKSGYDAIRDFTPIAMLGGTPNLLVVSRTVPVNTLQEICSICQGQPGQGRLRHLGCRHLEPPALGRKKEKKKKRKKKEKKKKSEEKKKEGSEKRWKKRVEKRRKKRKERKVEEERRRKKKK